MESLTKNETVLPPVSMSFGFTINKLLYELPRWLAPADYFMRWRKSEIL